MHNTGSTLIILLIFFLFTRHDRPRPASGVCFPSASGVSADNIRPPTDCSSGSGGGTHAFVRYFSAHDARQAFDALDGKYAHSAHGPSSYVRIRVGIKRQRSVGRALWPLAPEKAVVLLQHYLPLG